MRRILPLLSLALLACPGKPADTTPPTVSSVSPQKFAQDVALNSAISVTFDEAIDAASVNAQTFTVNGDVAGTYSVDGSTATLTPVAALPRNTSLTVTLEGIKDAAGNELADPYTWTFTTGTSPDTTAPKAIAGFKAKTGGITPSSVELTWYATGDDGTLGTATAYDLRYRAEACVANETAWSDEKWASATVVTGLPAPQAFNTPESFVVTGLAENTDYCFAIKASDEVPNVSAISTSSRRPPSTTPLRRRSCSRRNRERHQRHPELADRSRRRRLDRHREELRAALPLERGLPAHRRDLLDRHPGDPDGPGGRGQRGDHDRLVAHRRHRYCFAIEACRRGAEPLAALGRLGVHTLDITNEATDLVGRDRRHRDHHWHHPRPGRRRRRGHRHDHRLNEREVRDLRRSPSPRRP